MKKQPVVQFDEETSKTFLQCQGVDSRIKDKGVMAEDTWRCATAFSIALTPILALY